MVTVAVRLLLLSAFYPPVYNNFTTHHFSSVYMNFTTALKACRVNYTDLMSVYSDEEYTVLRNLMKSESFLIGLHRSNFSEKWSNGDPVTFNNLTNVCGTNSSCAVMKADGLWERLLCTATSHFICYKKDAFSGTLNYHVIVEHKTWYEAQSYCRGTYTDLASIRDQQQNEELKNIVLTNNSTRYWIGLLCDDWQWTDGGNSAYRNWPTNEPRSSPYDCVRMSYWGWQTVLCSSKYRALCYNTGLHVSDLTLNWHKALDYCHEGNRAGILIIDSQADQEALDSELTKRSVPAGSLWVGLGPNRLVELEVSSSRPLTCEEFEKEKEVSDRPTDTNKPEAVPDYVMDFTELRVVCKLKPVP